MVFHHLTGRGRDQGHASRVRYELRDLFGAAALEGKHPQTVESGHGGKHSKKRLQLSAAKASERQGFRSESRRPRHLEAVPLRQTRHFRRAGGGGGPEAFSANII